MATKDWTEQYTSGSIDTNSNQASLINGSDVTRVSQIHSVRDAVQKLEAIVGVEFNVTGSGNSLLQQFSDHTASFATLSSSYVSHTSSFQSYTASFAPDMVYVKTHANDLPRSIAALSGTHGTVVISSGSTCIITASFNTTSSATLQIDRNGLIQVNDAVALKISGSIDAGNYQIFNVLGAGSTELNSGSLGGIIFDTWWGQNYTYANTLGRVSSGIILTGSGADLNKGSELLISGSGTGLILTSPDGSHYRFTVNNAGELQITGSLIT